jgi:hypothetical protein
MVVGMDSFLVPVPGMVAASSSFLGQRRGVKQQGWRPIAVVVAPNEQTAAIGLEGQVTVLAPLVLLVPFAEKQAGAARDRSLLAQFRAFLAGRQNSHWRLPQQYSRFRAFLGCGDRQTPGQARHGRSQSGHIAGWTAARQQRSSRVGSQIPDPPAQETCNPALPQSVMREGILVGMCDGSVRLIGNEVGPDVWGFALHPANAHDFKLPDD